MIPETYIEEGLSNAYVMAILTKAGYNYSQPINDFGTDIIINNVVKIGNRVYEDGHILRVQLKATFNWKESGNFIKYSLENKNYNDLSFGCIENPFILVVLCLPKLKKKWVSQTIDQLILAKCAFWTYLGGNQPKSKKESKTVIYIPKINIFSVDNLNLIFKRIKNGEEIYG